MVDKGPASSLFETRSTASARATESWFGIGKLTSPRDVGAVVAIVAFMALVFLGPIMTLSDTAATGDSGNSLRQIGYFLIFALAIWAADPLRRGWRVLVVPVPIVVALVWCWLSLTWAVEPGIGFRRLLLTSMVVWTCFIIVQGAGYKLTLGAVRMTLAVALVVNFAVVFAEPSVGMHTAQVNNGEAALVGDWRGLMAHKNFAGALCGLTIICYAFDARAVNRYLRIGVILLSALFLLKSGSKTSAGMVVLALLIAYGYTHLDKRRRIYLVPLAMIVSALGLMVYSYYADRIAGSVLGPTAFTGRGMIWTALVNYIGDHPLLGSGFGSFWNIGDDSPIYQYGKGFVAIVTVGHNGYLDLSASVGIPGMVLVVLAMIVWPMIRLLAGRGMRSEVGGLVCALVAFGLGHNVTESSMFARDAIVGVFMLLAVAFTDVMALPAGARGGERRKKRAAGDELMSTMRRRKRRSA